MSYFSNTWRSIVFWGGDVKKINAFPYVTWAEKKHLVNYDEILATLPLIKYGDVGLHRECDYLSNIVIPGFMKHAWIHVEDGIKKPTIVEAVSEGVISRSALYPMLSDYTIILTPKNATENDRKGACLKARQLCGHGYDVNFEFDIEKELQFYHCGFRKDAIADLKEEAKGLKKYVPTFSCTETVGYAWWHRRESLRLYRKEVKNKSVLLADMFLNGGWDIKWMSKSVTLDAAKSFGLHEEGLCMIEEFLCSK